MKEIIFQSMTLEELKKVISNTIKKELKELKTEEDRLLTREEAANVLNISLATLKKWTDKGIIPAYKISSNIRYKKSEILSSLDKVESLKYSRDM